MKSLATIGALAAVDLAEARDLAVGGRLVAVLGPRARDAEQARLDEGAGVDQRIDALARIQDAGRLAASRASRRRPSPAPWRAGARRIVRRRGLQRGALAVVPGLAHAPPARGLVSATMPSPHQRIDVAVAQAEQRRASTLRVSWPMSRPAWRTAPGVADIRGTTAGHRHAAQLSSGAATIELRAR